MGPSKTKLSTSSDGTSRVGCSLRKLVVARGIHPGVELTGTEPGERAATTWVTEFLGRRGADVRMDSFLRGRSLESAALGVWARGCEVALLLLRFETVGIAGMNMPRFPLSLRVEDMLEATNGVSLRSRTGASRTKGRVVAALLRVFRSRSSRKSIHLNLWKITRGHAFIDHVGLRTAFFSPEGKRSAIESSLPL